MAEPKAKKVFDVAKPGKSAPSASSKPILVTNRPVLKDPMMTDATSDSQETATPQSVAVTNHVKIAPIGDTSNPEPEEVAAEASSPEPVDSEAEATATTDTDPTAAATPAAGDPVADEPASDNRDELKDVKTDDNDNAAELAAQQKQERDDELQKLALSRKYYLPINQVEHRRTRRVTWLGAALILLLALAWADVALDAGLITIPGVKAFTHFFSK